MVSYFGDFAEDDTVLIPFNTFSSDDPAASVTITNLADGDLKVHKDGSVTQIVTDGATIAIDFDGITGNHLATIDTSAHADYATGSEYAVRMEGTTVDGATINAWIGAFSIERAGGVLALLKGTNSLANIEDKIDIIDTNVDDIETAVITNAAGVDIAADIIAVKAETAAILDDTDLIDDGTSGLAKIATDVAATLVDTAVIGVLGAGLTNIPWNSSWDAEVQSEVDDALIAKGLDHLVFTSVTGTDVADNSIIAKLVDDAATADWDGYDPTTASLEALNVDTDAIKAETALIVADTNELQVDNLPGLISALNDITAASVWAVDATGEQTQGTFGQAMGDPGADADTIYGSVVTGAAGANISVDIIAVKAETAAIVNDTDLIDDGTSGLAKIATDVAAVLVDTTGLNGDAMRGTDSAATAANLATVDTVVDAIKVVTDKLDAADSEPTGVPAANETPLAKLAHLFMMARNKVTVTSSKKTYFGDDGAAEFEKDLSDDATTYTETETNVI